jgi:DNA topoisomerase-1
VIGTSEDGVEIKANFGRFGPYVQKNTTYASIPKDESVFTVSLERAVELIREKESKPKRVFRRFRKSKES